MKEIKEDPPRKALVKAIKEGHRGPYFEAECKIEKEIMMVTVSLNRDVWQEKAWPEGGMEVIISDIRKKRAGWRAFKARFYRLYDKEI